MSLSQEDIETLQRTWKQLAAIGLEELGLKILHKLFTDQPQTMEYFQGMGLNKVELTIENMRTNKRVALHAKSVAISITEIVNSLGEENGPSKVFERLTKIHKRKGVDPKNFELMGIVFLGIIEESLTGPDANSEVLSLWKTAYGAIQEGIVKNM